MSHYRIIDIEGTIYRYVVGSWRTKVDSPNASFLFDNTVIGRHLYGDRLSVTPGCIEIAIRRELGIPQREYDWDTPVTKADPGPRTRGFRHLIGCKIVDVRVSAINEVILEADNGARFALESELVSGLPVNKLRVLKAAENEDAPSVTL